MAGAGSVLLAMKKIKRILITAGPTREHIDPVRFITNLSSGRMGFSLARSALRKGYKVSLVSGPVDLRPPRGASFYPVVSALQMKKACAKLFRSHDCLIMTAAVCDFMPSETGRHKLPSRGGLTLRLKRTPDILAGLSRNKGKRIVIGFCLETKDLLRRAGEKLAEKNLDGIVANYYDPARHIPFGKRKVRTVLIDRTGKVCRMPAMAKMHLAEKLLRWMKDFEG
jgi:phosphopantothenoylcysteine decarboxylase/phosphopantothenate--cysteine ligase